MTLSITGNALGLTVLSKSNQLKRGRMHNEAAIVTLGELKDTSFEVVQYDRPATSGNWADGGASQRILNSTPNLTIVIRSLKQSP